MDIKLAGVSFHDGEELTVGVGVYRSPSGDIKLFISNIAVVLNYITDRFKYLIIVGRFNNNNYDDKDIPEFRGIMTSFNSVCKINELTWISLELTQELILKKYLRTSRSNSIACNHIFYPIWTR